MRDCRGSFKKILYQTVRRWCLLKLVASKVYRCRSSAGADSDKGDFKADQRTGFSTNSFMLIPYWGG